MSGASATRAGAKQRLMSELASLQKENWVHINDKTLENIFKWKFALCVINSDSLYNGGYFRAEMTFSDQYPYSPPTFKFLSPIIYHPNIYSNGNLCISILHTPGEDLMSGESASERWSPLQGVESVLRSVLLLLDDPEISSPANVDAGVLYRDNRTEYEERAKKAVEESRKHIPSDFTFPTAFESAPPPKNEDNADFWMESDEEFDFGSESDEDMDDFEDNSDDD
ncbi:ubiquitin-conjugating enzyme [Zalerion maritima]|uniref:Ubiquitin-conjugating enzyme E2 2 n=1 Tax=Zalerion maritima TaxID=339359 RepID=A0AAD5WSC5_9PEZI|nr:ubiquitin-conjugating enzyme [Zalerion maritima]